LFSVKSAHSHRMGDDNELVVPALQVGVGPGTPATNIEFMYGPRTESAWLCEPRDHIVVKVKEPSTLVLLTSVYAEGLKPLELEVKRLDNPNPVRPSAATAPSPTVSEPQPQFQARAPRSLAAPSPQQPAMPAPHAQAGGSVRLQITAHVQNRGDVVFSDSQWAGFVGQRLTVESFTILPLEAIAPAMIEYKAITSTGIETPWVSGGSPCGTRGLGVPLVGFAIRLKPPMDATYHCEYGAALVSGARIGPMVNGAPCRSPDPANPIEGIWVSIAARTPAQVEPSDEQLLSSRTAPSGQARQPIGPRFSVFREPVGE